MTNVLLRLLVGCLVAGACIGSCVAASNAPDIFQNIKFRNVGPAIVGGRVTSVAGVPGRPNLFYVGTAGGGVWKTTTRGNSWKPIFEHQPTSSIGVVALVPSAPAQVWVGTGEPDIRNDVIDGAGAFFSPDGGKTWQDKGLDTVGQIGAIVIDDDDPGTVFVAALGNIWRPTSDRGVYRTTDGGKTWQKVLYIDANTGAIDIEQVPGHPDVLFAAMWQVTRLPWELQSGGPESGLYRSTDAGKTWEKLKDGLPTGPVGRIAIAVAPSNPDHVYALIGSKQGVLWESTDMGDSWHMVSNDHAINVRPFYFSTIEVAPDDENRVYFGAVRLRQSDDGGKTSHIIDKSVHVDHHALWIDPANPDFMIQGNDGGVYVSPDRGSTWRFLDNLPIGQFYSVAVDGSFPFNLCGGTQDNGGWCGPSSNFANKSVTGIAWRRIVGGDGHYVVPAWSMPTLVYADSQRGNIVRHDSRTGNSRYIRPSTRQVMGTPVSDLEYRFNWTSPIAVSRNDHRTVYLGSNVLFKSTDGGEHWKAISDDLTRNDKTKQVISGGSVYKDNSGAETYDTILAITIAPDHPDVIWVGTDDGLVQVTRDGGKHWNNVTPSGAPEWARIPQIGVSPFDPGTAYVAVDAHKLGDRSAYAYRTRDFGKTWEAITSGIAPDTPVRVVREDPNRQGFLVMGTGTGLYYSHDAGGSWRALTANFPTAPVVDLRFASGSDSLAVATHGRGLFVLDNLLPLEFMTPARARSSFVLLPAKPGVLVSGSVARPTYGNTTYSVRNAPRGVTLSYFLGAEAESTASGRAEQKVSIKISISDASGNPVATRTTTAKAGAVNQYVWNMRYDGPTKLAGSRKNPAGPRVLAGTYRAVVATRNGSRTQSILVLRDPRIGAPRQASRQQLRAALQVRNELGALNQMLNDIVEMRTALEARHTRSSTNPNGGRVAELAKAGHALNTKLEALQDSVYNPDEQHNVPEDRLHGLLDFRARLAALARLVSRNTGAATAAATSRDMLQMREALQKHLAMFNGILKVEVGAYIAAARKAGLPGLKGIAPIHIAPTPYDNA